jgi:hypothetical protein
MSSTSAGPNRFWVYSSVTDVRVHVNRPETWVMRIQEQWRPRSVEVDGNVLQEMVNTEIEVPSMERPRASRLISYSYAFGGEHRAIASEPHRRGQGSQGFLQQVRRGAPDPDPSSRLMTATEGLHTASSKARVDAMLEAEGYSSRPDPATTYDADDNLPPGIRIVRGGPQEGHEQRSRGPTVIANHARRRLTRESSIRILPA